MQLRTVTLVAAVCVTTGWLLASVLTPPVAKLQVLPERRVAQDPSRSDFASASVEQLQLRLRRAPAAPTPRRNPFVFGTQVRENAGSRLNTATAPPPTAEVPPSTAPVGPIFSLSGIGVSNTPQGDVRTGVLSNGDRVYIVKAGDSVGGYTVADVTMNSVTLVDAAGAQYVLRLKY